MSKHIETKQGLRTLFKRYQEAGVTDETKDINNAFPCYWITCIKQCIADGLAMDETDYENTSLELRKLWRGLK